MSTVAGRGSATWGTTRVLYVACAVAGLLAVGWLHHEVLFGGQVYHMDDAADGYYPSHVAILRAFGAGHLPTWERGAWCGWPLVADPYYGAFYPPTVLFALLGAVGGLGWQAALHVLLAGLGMFLLLERRRLDVGPALLGAASIALGSFMVVRIRHIIFVQGLAWMPLCLYFIEGWIAERRRRELALAGLAGGLALLCGALPLALFFAFFAAAYALPRLLRAPNRAEALGGLAVMALLAGLVAMAQIAPTFAHIPHSPRGAIGTDFTFASSYAWPKWEYLGTLIAPEIFGHDDRAQWYGQYNHWEMAGYYAGALVVLLAPLGLLRAGRRPELIALFVLALVGILLAFGARTPLHKLFYNWVPVYSSLRCPTRALVMFLLGMPILAAEGLTWLAAPERRGTRRALVGAAVAFALLVAGGVGAWKILHPKLRVLPPELASRHAFAQLVVVVAIGGAIVALLVGGVLKRREATLALALVTIVDLLVVGRANIQPRPGDYAAGMERFAAVDWLIAHKPVDRFAPDPYGPFRLHNLGMVYGLEGASGYDSVSVWHYVNFLYTLNNGGPYPWPTLRTDLAQGDVKNWRSPLVDLLNVRWAIATAPPAPGWIERFHPQPGARPHATYEPTWDPRLNVYENPHPLPRAFVVYRAEVHPEDAAQARALSALDPRKRVILDRAPSPPPVGDDRPFTPAREVRLERQRVTIEAEATAPGILVLSDVDYPGWRATVDGQPAPILRADYAFRGVALPAGRYTVVMTYASWPTRIGLGLSIFGLFGLILLAVRGDRGRARPRVV
jgi:hypothetical protein